MLALATRPVFPRSTSARPLLYCFIFLYLAAAAPGPGPIDRDWRKLGDSDLGGCQLADRLAPPAAPEEQGSAREHHEPSRSLWRSGRAGVAIDCELQ
jgi:hypothetical protein